MAIAGISTLNVRFLYGIETTAGTKPATFTELHRINSIGGVTVSTESIDASALEDSTTRYIAGRGEVDGTLAVTVNLTPDTITEWETLISAYETAKAGGKSVWFETYSDKLGGDAFFVIAEPPAVIPQPETNQNELWTVEMTLTVNEFKGMDTAVLPTP